MRERGLKYLGQTQQSPKYYVAPHAGAWIEIGRKLPVAYSSRSLPMRERGLKSYLADHAHILAVVAPHAGAWIEINPKSGGSTFDLVAPHAGAWIEMSCPLCKLVNHSGRSPCGSVD